MPPSVSSGLNLRALVTRSAVPAATPAVPRIAAVAAESPAAIPSASGLGQIWAKDIDKRNYADDAGKGDSEDLSQKLSHAA
jgi:hypothetical protein